MHPGLYSLTLFLDKETKIRLGEKSFTFPEGFYIYVEGHKDAHSRVSEHLNGKKSEHRIDLFMKKAHVLDTKVSRVKYADGKRMLRDLLKVRKILTQTPKAQITPVLGLYHVPGPVIVAPKFSRMFK